MNTLDIILLIPLIWGAYRGFRKGFLLEVIAILAFILAIIGGFKLLHLGMDLLSEHFNIAGKLLPYIAFIVIFILIILMINLLGKLLKKVVDLTLLGPIDSMAGAVLSVLKWAFGLSVIFWLSSSFGLDLPEEWTVDSVLYPYLLSFAPKAAGYFAAVVPFAHDLFDMIKGMLQNDSAA